MFEVIDSFGTGSTARLGAFTGRCSAFAGRRRVVDVDGGIDSDGIDVDSGFGVNWVDCDGVTGRTARSIAFTGRWITLMARSIATAFTGSVWLSQLVVGAKPLYSLEALLACWADYLASGA